MKNAMKWMETDLKKYNGENNNTIVPLPLLRNDTACMQKKI